MEKSDVIEFFDRCAPFWDEEMVRNESVITKLAGLMTETGLCVDCKISDHDKYIIFGVRNL